MIVESTIRWWFDDLCYENKSLYKYGRTSDFILKKRPKLIKFDTCKDTTVACLTSTLAIGVHEIRWASKFFPAKIWKIRQTNL